MATINITPVEGQGVFEGNAVEQVLSDEIPSGHGQTMPAGTVVAINDTSQLIPAKANNLDTSRVLGLLRTAIDPGESGRVIINGATAYILDPTSPDLKSGQTVYLSENLAGAVTGTSEQSAASAVVPVGRVLGNILYVEVGDPVGDIAKQIVSTLMTNNTAEALPLGSVLAADDQGGLHLASAVSLDQADVIGICLQTIQPGAQGRVVIGGETNFLLESGIPNPEQGALIYLSATQPGRATPVPAGLPGAVVLPLGKTVNGALYIEIGTPIVLGD